MDIKLKKWIHPATGQIRLYVQNQNLLGSGEKVWFEETDCQFRSASMKRSGPRNSMFNLMADKIDRELRESGINTDKWIELLNNCEA